MPVVQVRRPLDPATRAAALELLASPNAPRVIRPVRAGDGSCCCRGPVFNPNRCGCRCNGCLGDGSCFETAETGGYLCRYCS